MSAPKRGRERERDRDEEIVLGLRATLALWEARPADIRRVAYIGEVEREIGQLLDWCVDKKIPHKELSASELSRFADSQLHEGVACSTKPRVWATPKDLGDLLVANKGCAIAFDRVRNPYNVGAILRTAAFYGVEAAFFGPMAPLPALAPTAIRVAEGGTERLLLTRTTDLGGSLKKLRGRGITVVGADGRGATNAFDFRFPKPIIIVMGNEREGLSEHVRSACDAIVAIPGSGVIESLNVSIAASILMTEAVRGRYRAAARATKIGA